MRKSVFSICMVCLCASFALAQGKVANEWKCAKPAMQHSVEVGDQPNHAYSISQTKCAATKGEIGGVKEKEGTGTDFIEVTGNNSSGHGVFVETMANGDKINYTYTASGTMKNAQMASGTNKWQASGATGKFKGIKASGTCKGTGNPDGSITWTCSGTYSLPK